MLRLVGLTLRRGAAALTTTRSSSVSFFSKEVRMSTKAKPFRNPHNLPVKTCVTCKRPFTWRKKWEKCWDDVTTCSKKCNRERRKARREEKRKEEGGEGSSGAAAQGGTAAAAAAPAAAAASVAAAEEQCGEQDDRDEGKQGSASAAAAPTSKAERRRRRKELKAERRARREGREEELDVTAKTKDCDLCGRSVQLLIRCRVDASKHSWKMVCGKCWKTDDVSGGVPDGAVGANPNYTYGGLWKAR